MVWVICLTCAHFSPADFPRGCGSWILAKAGIIVALRRPDQEDEKSGTPVGTTKAGCAPCPWLGTSPCATYVSVDEVRGFPSPRDRRGGSLCAAASFQTAVVSLCFDSRPYSFYAPGTQHWAQALFEPG